MMIRRVFVAAAVVALSACGGGETTIGGNNGQGGGAAGGAANTGGGNAGTAGGQQNTCPDADGDGHGSCNGDCNDADPAVHPGATETANSVDDDCDGKVDNHVVGGDFDGDGYQYGVAMNADCNDDEPLVGPGAIEDPTNMVDDNCNGVIDEAPALCEDAATGAAPGDFARAIGLCNGVAGSVFPIGDAQSRGIRTGFGDQWMPRAGSKMIMLSSGRAVDNVEASSYNPDRGFSFNTLSAHPLYSRPPASCGVPTTTTPDAEDMTELTLTLKVPQNAKSFSYEFTFFSAEYPEYVCTEFNDRFIAILQSQALVPAMLPSQNQCKSGEATPTCNISYDSRGEPITINNALFAVCDSYQGRNVNDDPVNNVCTKPSSQLSKTGYDKRDMYNLKMGGGTGWLTTKAPVRPNETITLRFIVFDEGDAQLDSAVLIDNFKWEFDSVGAPTTEPTVN